jgi:formylglycine-generating enzyme required for sulfatase activity
MKTKFLFSLVLLSFLYFGANAHGVDVSNVSVTGNDITFDISWKNSWNSYANTNPNYPKNRSGIWVFLKVQNDVTNEWSHQKVSNVAADHSNPYAPPPALPITIYPSTDGIGVMLHHFSQISSFASFSARVKLKMDAVPIGNLNFKVFAIEMVEASQGAYQIGDGRTNYLRLDTFTVSSPGGVLNPGIPANELLHLYSSAGLSHPGICCNYPIGFWKTNVMRYECSNEQYVEFLNTLTYDQQRALTDIPPDASANSSAFQSHLAYNNNIIKIKVPGISNAQPAVYACDYNGNNIYDENGDGQNQAFGIASVRRALSYLDWSGLRPMSELEYEKFTRGSDLAGNAIPRIIHEYAWGTDSVVGIRLGDASNIGQDNERYSGPSALGRAVCAANAVSNISPIGPMRVGQLSGPATGREASGASFYGIMDMSGNVAELCYSVFYSDKTLDRSDYGDGIISNNTADVGEHNVSNWPSSQADSAFVLRGGHCSSNINTTTYPGTSDLQISQRSTTTHLYIEPLPTSSILSRLGIRGVRATD